MTADEREGRRDAIYVHHLSIIEGKSAREGEDPRTAVAKFADQTVIKKRRAASVKLPLWITMRLMAGDR